MSWFSFIDSAPLIASAIVVFSLGLVASLTLTPLVCQLAQTSNLVDRPDGSRKLHPIPVPRIGGIAVFLAFALALGLHSVFASGLASRGTYTPQTYVPLLIACGAVMLVGLADDILNISPWAKLLVQMAAALYLYAQGYRISSVTNPFGEPISFGAFALPLTVLWFVGMSNAFNLIDGLDGLAPGVALFAMVSFFTAAIFNDRPEAALLTAALAGTVSGFLRYNFSPASIFLGDSGSLFVGFALAAFAIQNYMKASAAIAVAAPLMALALPMLDLVLAVLRRLIAGRKIFEPDRDHIHHRLLRLGLTPRRAVVILYGVAALFTSLSLVVMTGKGQALAAALIAACLVTWAGIRHLGYAEISAIELMLNRRQLPQRHTLGNNLQLVRMREAFTDAMGVAELWDALIKTASRLDFDRVQIVLSPGWCENAAGRPLSHSDQPFPTWRRSTAPCAENCASSWTILLGDKPDPIGELRVWRQGNGQTLPFDAAYFVDAITNEFVGGLGRCFRPTVAAAPVAPNVTAGASARAPSLTSLSVTDLVGQGSARRQD